MDSRLLLDYALFHLTPTRTRCDLVVFCGGKSEKLASGLVEPFVAHLKYAKDQILKGGYSITLRPPTPDAFWFTKDTFQRFVRFVSTPEILERFLRTEQEISQIEKSIEVNEISNSKSDARDVEGSPLAVDGAPKNNAEGAAKGASEENSKFRLQRVLDTRKALLLKEQAMAFARAKAAGFKIENMDDLTYFADAFGASRLREACVGFRDLYMLKCKDARWMDEVAAMEAFPPNMFSYVGASGITLASDENNGSSDISDADKNTITDKGQPGATAAEFPMKMQWPNQVPHYMYNFQNPMHQVPPYPGYPYPGAHPGSPYYPEHVQWPSAGGRMNGFARQSHKSKKKGKSKNDSESEEDELSESGSSGSGSDTDGSGKHDKKHPLVKKKKKSSRIVVIRNINHITSKRRNADTDNTSGGSSSEENAELDEDAIKQTVVDAVASLKKHQHSGSHKKKSGRNRRLSIQNGTDDQSDHGFVEDSIGNMHEGGKTNENWNAFQDILMSQEKSQPNEVQEKNTLDVEDPLAVSISHDDNTFVSSPIVGFETEKVKVQRSTPDGSVIVTQRDGYNDGRTDVINITDVAGRRSSMRTRDSEDVQYVLSQNSEDSASSPWRMTSDPSADSSLIRNGNYEDWVHDNQVANSDIQESKQIILDESNTFRSAKDSNLMEVSKRASIDDSFMVQSHQSFNDQYDSEWRTDIVIESDLTMASPPVTGSQKPPQPFQEPDDVCVMVARDSVIESSWTPEMDFGIESSFTEVDKRKSVETKTEQTPIVESKSKSTNGKKTLKTSTKEARSRLLQGTISRGLANGSHLTKKPSSTNRLANPKIKVDKEEETRKRMEELVLERQKRIAERSASTASKKVLGRSKTTSPMMQETRRSSSNSVSAKS